MVDMGSIDLSQNRIDDEVNRAIVASITVNRFMCRYRGPTLALKEIFSQPAGETLTVPIEATRAVSRCRSPSATRNGGAARRGRYHPGSSVPAAFFSHGRACRSGRGPLACG